MVMNYIIICILSIVLMLLITSLALSNFELVMFIGKVYHKLIDNIKNKKRKKLINALPFINTYDAFNNFYDLRRYILYNVSIMKKDKTIIENCDLYLNDNEVYIYKDYYNNRIDNNDIIYISFNTKETYDKIKNNIEFFINVNVP